MFPCGITLYDEGSECMFYLSMLDLHDTNMMKHVHLHYTVLFDTIRKHYYNL